MKKHVVEIRLTGSEYIDKNEVTVVYYDFDCSWNVDSGALVVFGRADNKLVATFASGKWQYIGLVKYSSEEAKSKNSVKPIYANKSITTRIDG